MQTKSTYINIMLNKPPPARLVVCSPRNPFSTCAKMCQMQTTDNPSHCYFIIVIIKLTLLKAVASLIKRLNIPLVINRATWHAD